MWNTTLCWLTGRLLSTIDQCGRDTPDANILKMLEITKTYGRYD